jgi:hypothetical protein
MKRAYLSPIVTDLGSVSEMTRSRGGAYGEFVQPGRADDDRNRRRRRRRRGKDGQSED